MISSAQSAASISPNPATAMSVQTLFGVHARHVPCWMYVQDQGDGLVSFVGASHMGSDAHPLRYGSDRVHQFIVGETIVRPHMVLATDALIGSGLAGLATSGHDIDAMLGKGEYLLNAAAGGR